MADVQHTISLNSKNATKSMNDFANSVKNASKNIKNSNASFNGLNKNLNKMQGSLRNLTMDANRSTKGIKSFKNAIDQAKLALTAFIAVKLSEFFAKSMNSALAMIETVNLFNIALGETAEQTNSLIAQQSFATGLDLTSLQNAVGTYSLLGRSMGFTAEQTSVLATNTATLANDLASLTNVPIEQVLADLQSGLVGQTETVYKYGVDLTEASLEQIALEKGIAKSVRTMTQGEKLWLRYEKLLQATTLAQGDFARTIETPANQLRILGQRAVSLGRTFGSIFLNAFGNILPVLNAIITALDTILKLIARLIGFEAPKVENTLSDGFSGATGEIEEATGATADLNKELNNITAPFDELNAISKATASSGGGGSGGASLEMGEIDFSSYDAGLSKVKLKSDEIADSFLKWLGITRELNEETGQIEVNLSYRGFTDNLIRSIETGNFTAVGILIGQKLNEVIDLGISKVSWSNVGSGITKSLNNITSLINGFFISFDWVDLGVLIGEGLNTAIYSAIVFLQGLNFSLIGTSIGTAISTSLKTFDWSALGKSIGKGINSAVDFAFNLIKQIDASQLALNLLDTISNAIRTINWFQIGAIIATGFSKVFEFVNTFIANFDIIGMVSSLFQFLLGVITNINWVELGEFLFNLFGGVALGGTLKKVLEAIPTGVGSIISNIIDVFERLIKDVYDSVSINLYVLWDDIIKPFFTKNRITQYLKDFPTTIKGIFKDTFNACIAIVEKAVNFIIDKINTLQWTVPKWVPGIGGQTWGFNFPNISIPRLERGGMLEKGQLFQAGEAGAELIGSFNNKTTVMPLENSGFVEAIYNAVYNAILSAQSNGGTVIENILNLDGEVIYRNQQQIANQKGVNFNLGSFAR